MLRPFVRLLWLFRVCRFASVRIGREGGPFPVKTHQSVHPNAGIPGSSTETHASEANVARGHFSLAGGNVMATYTRRVGRALILGCLLAMAATTAHAAGE